MTSPKELAEGYMRVKKWKEMKHKFDVNKSIPDQMKLFFIERLEEPSRLANKDLVEISDSVRSELNIPSLLTDIAVSKTAVTLLKNRNNKNKEVIEDMLLDKDLASNVQWGLNQLTPKFRYNYRIRKENGLVTKEEIYLLNIYGENSRGMANEVFSKEERGGTLSKVNEIKRLQREKLSILDYHGEALYNPSHSAHNRMTERLDYINSVLEIYEKSEEREHLGVLKR